ncbi:helix-turn-helix domain-containing protein [Natronolimnobius sp. AArcel1]|uniref:helix-turn-helix domain-containing protein n=1 Tax=Natronolimnobius sp. AArcel1 TaxID=1679093 RepID=UPI001F1516E4|nr:helix-turn-helix domain-containing protein [Natronolimnobius sp. AArcel1]
MSTDDTDTNPESVIEGTSVDSVKVSMVVSEIDTAQEFVRCLEQHDATVHPESLRISPPTADTVTIDTDAITVKQWEALELAQELGYYESPREANLEDIANELSVSRSAVSQRLRGAESTLIGRIATELRAELTESS